MQLRTTHGAVGGLRPDRWTMLGRRRSKRQRLMAMLERRRRHRQASRARKGIGGLAAVAVAGSVAMRLRSRLGGRSSAGEPARPEETGPEPVPAQARQDGAPAEAATPARST